MCGIGAALCSLSLRARLYRSRTGWGVINNSCSVWRSVCALSAVGEGRKLPELGCWVAVGVIVTVGVLPPDVQDERSSRHIARKARAGASPAPTLLRIRGRCPYRVGAGLAPALVALTLRSLYIPLRLQFFETVADAAFRQDVFGVRRVFFDFLPQVGDIEAQVVGFIAVFAAPHFREEGFMRQQAASVADEVVEQAVFCGAQDDFFPAHDHFALREIDFEIIID